MNFNVNNGMSVMTVFTLLGLEAASSISRRFTIIPFTVWICLIFGSVWIYLLSWQGTTYLIGWSVAWFNGLLHTYVASLTKDMIVLATVIVIFGVSSTIILFSAGYMLGDWRYYEFIGLLLLFETSMISFVTGASLFWSISFWEGIGICSFALISFWCMRIHAIRASIQAMLVNKLGDVCIIVGVLGVINSLLGDDPWSFNLSYETLLITSLILVVGAMSKSALVTLHYWLPYAMEGPTSVSALIHAATLVTAGLFLLVKTKYILLSSATTVVLIVLASLGLCMLAFIAVDQYDIKRLVAYSTLSQVAYMLLAIVLGAPEIGVLYLLVHALFKSLMFMSCGSLIHGMYDQQDLRLFGGLSKVHLITGALIICSGLVMLGLACSMGAYSKELTVHVSGSSMSVYGWSTSLIVTLGLVGTTLYTSVLVWAPFLGASTYTYNRSPDDIGLYTTIILCMQVVSLLITGPYLNRVLLQGYNLLGSNECTSLSANTTDYSFAIIVIFMVVLVSQRSRSLVSLRVHTYKYMYDRVLNTLLVMVHEATLILRSDYIRTMLYIKWASDIVSTLFRFSYSRVVVGLIVALIVAL